MDTASPSTVSPRPKLRIGLLVDGLVAPCWVHDMVAAIHHSEFAEVVLLVENDPPPREPLLRRLIDRRSTLLYQLYTRLDALAFRATRDAFAPRNLKPLLADVPVIRVTPERTRFSDRFPAEDVEAIRGFDLDVAIRLGFRILRGGALGIARHGVWSYHHGDNRVNRGGPAGFWEVMERSASTGSILQVLTEELDGGHVLAHSQAHTDTLSVARNRTNLYWKTAEFIPRELKRLHARSGTDAGPRSPCPARLEIYSHRLYRQPSNSQMAGLLARHVTRVAARAVRRAVFQEQWGLAFAMGDTIPPLFRFRHLTPPRGHAWADPFPVATADGFCVFMEELVRGKGRISVMDVDERGNWSQPRPVLERPYHLSYPYVFQWDGAFWMIPETMENGTIELYRCVNFPNQWELHTVLMEGVRAADSTLVVAGGRWWMFTCMAPEGSLPWDELYLYHAPTPLGPWTPHPANPVVSDVRRARPAGRLFEWEGSLYRPAQDCGPRYGHSVGLFRVTRLDDETYEEVEEARILPEWDRSVLAVHTFNRAGRLAVVDCLRPRSRRPWS